MPFTDSTNDIGSNSVRWDRIYADNFYGVVDQLTVNSNDTFNGTYSLLWHAGATIYSSSFMTINGTTDTLSVPNISTTGNATFAGDVTIGNSSSSATTLNLVKSTSGVSEIKFLNVANEKASIQLDAAEDLQIFSNTSQQIKLRSGGADTLTLDSSQNATFAGNINFTSNDKVIKADLSSGGTTRTAEIKFYDSASGAIKYMTINSSSGGHEFWTQNVKRFEVERGGNATFAGDLTVSGGDITLGGTGRIQGVDTISDPTDAANKAYVDAHDGGAGVYLPLAGGTMTGDIQMQDELINFYTSGSVTLPQFRGLRSATDLNNRSWSTEGGWAYTTFDSSSSNTPSSGLHNANGLLSFNTHSGDYMAQIAMTTNTGKLWHRRRNGQVG